MTSIILLTFLVGSCCGAEFSSSARNFSIELMYFTHLDHFVMSPFCVWSLLTGVSLGGFGDSITEIQRATIIPKNRTKLYEVVNNLTETVFLSNPKGVDLSSRTYIFQDKNIGNIRRLYEAVLNRLLGAQLIVLDFKDTEGTTYLANRFIQNNFRTISNVFHTNDFMETSLIFSNVIHFRGSLSTPFNVSYTTEEIIYNKNNVAIGSVTMMYQKGKFAYSNFESMNSHILELPYSEDGKFCMLVIFPHPGLNPINIYTKLAKISLRDIFTKLEKDFNGLQEIEVKMPRFRMMGSYFLNKPLIDMGVVEAFQPDFRKFVGIHRDGLYISTVEHKAEIKFTETETVAYGTTPGYFDGERFKSIEAEQPFIFFLMEKPTASIIFGGIYSRHRLNEIP